MEVRSIYSALPQDHIRLLYVAKNVDRTISYRLATSSLSPSPDYVALSYVWGANSKETTISCNGSDLTITVNLHGALEALSDQIFDSNMPIWIDAICINQQNNLEKGIQVARMSKIYSNAHHVVAWLGPSDRGSDMVMDSLHQLSQVLPTVPVAKISLGHSMYKLPDSSDELWPALGHLVCRPWFERLWTFQEAVLGRDVLVVCGQKSVSWDSLVIVAKEMIRLNIESRCNSHDLQVNGFQKINIIHYTKSVLADYGYVRFPTLLMIADVKHCTDSRDRVYGMLGLTSETFRRRIPVFYLQENKDDYLQLYLDCAIASIEVEPQEPYILQTIAGRPRIDGLPSWCPNMISGGMTLEPFGTYLHAGLLESALEFSPSGDRIWPHLPAKVIHDSNTLSIAGFRVGTVAEVVDETPGNIQDVQRFPAWESRCLKLAQKAYQVPTVPINHILTITANTRARIASLGNEVSDDDLLKAYQDIVVNLRNQVQPPEARYALFYDFWLQIFRFCKGRTYFSTVEGRVGLGPPGTRAGDTVCVLYGTHTVFVLRPQQDDNTAWSLVGDAYLNGMMELEQIPEFLRQNEELFLIK